jgi:PAS domain S-box-containing protein
MSENSHATSSSNTPVLAILLLALCYTLAGRLSVLLAIPPGYATAIFPPAGIALVVLLLFGKRLAPGVFIGSFLLNLWIAHDSGTEVFAGLPVALGAATGATLQALLACFLVGRYVKAPDELTRDTDIILFLLLAGPIACTVNATFGVSSLYYSGALDATGLAYAWFTWWVGDSLGVVVSAPLLFILLAPSIGVWRKRRFAVGLPLLLMSVALIWMFIKFSSWEVRQRQFEFREEVNVTQKELEARLERNVLALGALERFFSYSKEVSRAEFQGYAAYFLQNDNVRALSWNHYITKEQRSALEAKLQRELGVPYIFDLPRQNKKAPAQEAEQYVVVEYIEPIADNAAVIGLNILSNTLREKALLAARDSGKLTASARINLLQSDEDAVLLVYPVYATVVATVEQRRRHIMGYITGVFAFEPLIDRLLAGRAANMLHIQLIDRSNNDEILYQSAPLAEMDDDLMQSFNMIVGGRQWQVQYWQAADYKNYNSDFLAFAVLTLGLLFTSILGAFLLVVTGRAHHIGQLVTKRSAELKGILDNAIDTILTFDAEGKIDRINPAGETLLHYHHNSLVGQSVRLILPELDLQQYLTNVDELSNPLTSRLDSIAQRQDGTAIAVEVALSKMLVNGEIRFTVILRDLTERNKAEKLKDDIISTVSHELRTPLTSIMGSLGIVNSGVVGVLPEKAAELVGLAMQNSQRLTMLVNDILELSKHQAQSYRQAQQPVALANFLRAALSLNSGYASQYDVELILQPVATDIVISGDEVKLMQVMSNLLSNAIKYSPQHSSVTVAARLFNEEYVDITVQDKGNGIPEAFQQQVFQRFSQADSTDTRRVGGTGLGLAIAKIIVEKHQGQIWFDTAAGKGTIFTVRLPLYFA